MRNDLSQIEIYLKFSYGRLFHAEFFSSFSSPTNPLNQLAEIESALKEQFNTAQRRLVWFDSRRQIIFIILLISRPSTSRQTQVVSPAQQYPSCLPFILKQESMLVNDYESSSNVLSKV